ncbi:MAG: holin-associated N-acetylmuramidase [Pseudomonadota bacterium]
MKSVSDLTYEILRREGGYVNDPDDPGGATNHGVTIHTMRRLGLDLDGDGRVTSSDVKRLSLIKAAEIFEAEYFKGPRIHEMPIAIQPSLYDMSVNSGSNAVKILQRLLNRFGQSISVDGGIGPQTVKAAYSVARSAPDHFADAYGIDRRNYYYRLGDQRPALRKFARRRDGGKGGWILRAEEFISPRFHFTRSDHDRRTQQWD